MWIEFELTEKEFESLEQFSKESSSIQLILERMVVSYKHVEKTKRNQMIFELRKQGYTYKNIAKTFGLSLERVRQICLTETRKRTDWSRRQKMKAEGYSDFYNCVVDACSEFSSADYMPVKIYNTLARCGITKEIEKDHNILDTYTDADLLKIPGIGPTSIDIIRKANDFYKEIRTIN